MMRPTKVRRERYVRPSQEPEVFRFPPVDRREEPRRRSRPGPIRYDDEPRRSSRRRDDEPRRSSRRYDDEPRRNRRRDDDEPRRNRRRDDDEPRRANTDPVPKGTELSLVIPWVHIKTTEEFVRSTLDELEWGKILKVDFVHQDERTYTRDGATKTNPEHFKVYIHLGRLTSDGKKVDEHLSSSKSEDEGTSKMRELKMSHRFGSWNVRKSIFKFKSSSGPRNGSHKVKVEFL
jgi:hypothetical protein